MERSEIIKLNVLGQIMKIMKLYTGGKVGIAVAEKFKPMYTKTDKKEQREFFNLKHGLKEAGFYEYPIFLRHHIFKDQEVRDSFILDRNDYVLKPIYNKVEGLIKFRKNKSTGYQISIAKDFDPNTTLVLWDIPNFYYVDVEYKIISGNVYVVGEGSKGLNRNNKIYKSPAPVLETQGDIVIEWSGKDINGKVVGETLTRTNDEWKSVPLIKEGE